MKASYESIRFYHYYYFISSICGYTVIISYYILNSKSYLPANFFFGNKVIRKSGSII
nr:MAG TPA: hypothetical protein [Bacteriophage sp.]